MLSRWLQRGRIGQILAPDPSIMDDEETAERSEFTGGFWSVIAPDPNFTNSTKVEDDVNEELTDQSDYQVTPSKHSHIREKSPQPYNNNVELLVMSAAKDLASCVASPPAVWEDHKKFFNYCASSSKLSDKQLRKVKKMLRKDPSLATSRASKMGFLIPDGFTPLHAVAFVGNYEVALILIDFCLNSSINSDDQSDEKEYGVSLDARDVQGRTPLHIASEQGHMKLVKLLKTKMSERDPDGIMPIGEHAPTDLTGRTPMGWAAMSTEVMACKNRDALRRELFSPGDKSVFGKKTPALDRTGGRKRNNFGDMDLVYGFSEMPGMRIEMEDAICHTFPLLIEDKSRKSNIEVGFFGVFDGHGDGGICSNYVADHIVQCFTATQECKDFDGNCDGLAQALSKACGDIDIDLKAMLANGSSVRNGGSTGVMAVVTQDEIIIGNVGDSRCILVQKAASSEAKISLSDELEKKLVIEEAEDVKEEKEAKEGEEVTSASTSTENVVEDKLSESAPQSRLPETTTETSKKVEVKALSTDHKPDLPEEKLRIEKAGLEVIEEIVPSDDKDNEENTTSIWKIKKSDRDKIAVSRAFGDFDYKANEDLKFEEQAIVCVPEVTIHKRDHASDMFLVLACDGVFDVMTNDEVGEFVAKKADERNENGISISAEILPEVGDDLLKHCLELGSSDNMSVLIVALPSCNSVVLDGATKKLEFADV
jgi:serine/threonine protein phosphatase PrpC